MDYCTVYCKCCVMKIPSGSFGDLGKDFICFGKPLKIIKYVNE